MLSIISNKLLRAPRFASQQRDTFGERVVAGSGSVIDATEVYEVYKLGYELWGATPRRWYTKGGGVRLNGQSNTNLLLHSNDFSNAAWTKTDVTVTANAEANPINGTVDADLLTEGSAGTANTLQGYTVSSGAVVTQSYYVKRQANLTWIVVNISNTGGTSSSAGYFNIVTGVKGTQVAIGSGVNFAFNIESLGANWYRLTVTGSITGETTYQLRIRSASADSSTTRVASAGYYVYSAQAQTGTIATDAITTTTTTASTTQSYLQQFFDLNNVSPVDALQTTAANQPYWYYDYSIGKRVPFFDGSNDVMAVGDLGIFNAQGAGTLVAVANDLNRAGGDTTHNAVFVSTNNADNPRLALATRRAGTSNFAAMGRKLDADSEVNANTASLVGYNYLAATASWSTNGLQVLANATTASASFVGVDVATSPSDSLAFNIGGRNTTTNRMYGTIPDIIADRTVFTTTQLAAIRTLQKAFNSALP